MSKRPPPTQDEELLAWHDLAFEIKLYRSICPDKDKLNECLDRICAWADAHRDMNGRLEVEEIVDNVADSFWTNIYRK